MIPTCGTPRLDHNSHLAQTLIQNELKYQHKTRKFQATKPRRNITGCWHGWFRKTAHIVQKIKARMVERIANIQKFVFHSKENDWQNEWAAYKMGENLNQHLSDRGLASRIYKELKK